MRIVERLNLNCAEVRVDVVKEDGAGVLVDDGMADTGGGVADFGRTMQQRCEIGISMPHECTEEIRLTCAREASSASLCILALLAGGG